jgi:hypothetical protein
MKTNLPKVYFDFIKECKMIKGLVVREAAMVSLMWGLKISNYDK